MVSTWMGDHLGTPCAVGINFEFFHLHSALTTLTIRKCSEKFFLLIIHGYKISSPVKKSVFTNKFVVYSSSSFEVVGCPFTVIVLILWEMRTTDFDNDHFLVMR